MCVCVCVCVCTAFLSLSNYYVLSLNPFSELASGTLAENGIADGTEVRLVPAIESGVMVSGRGVVLIYFSGEYWC